jgi:hypothetical protein
MKTEALNMIVDFRSRGNIPYKVSVDILRYLTRFVDLIVSETAEATEGELDTVADFATLKERIISTKENLLPLKDVIPSLSTEYRIRKVYDQHPHFVCPEPIVLGYRDETVLTKAGGESTIRIVNRPDLAQYCPMSKTIKKLSI